MEGSCPRSVMALDWFASIYGAAAGNVAIQFSGLPTGFIRGSKYELMRVFQNLFKNSLEAGATRLLVSAARNEAQLELVITDNGSGMDEAQLRAARRFGWSQKSPQQAVGFRGIGIYSSFGMCETMTIRTRKKGMSDVKGTEEVFT